MRCDSADDLKRQHQGKRPNMSSYKNFTGYAPCPMVNPLVSNTPVRKGRITNRQLPRENPDSHMDSQPPAERKNTFGTLALLSPEAEGSDVGMGDESGKRTL